MTNSASGVQSRRKQGPEHFILFRRFPQKPGEADQIFSAVSTACGIDPTDLRYRLIGPGLGVLLPKTDLPAMESCAGVMDEQGMPAAVLSKSGLAGASLPPRAKRVRSGRGFIEFQSAEEEALLRIDGSSELLVIATDLSGKAVRQVLTSMAYTSRGPAGSFAEMLEKITMGRAAAVVHDLRKNPAQGVFIDSGAFVFLGLKEQATPSRGRNFRILIERSMELAGSAATDSFFGIAALPGTKPDWNAGAGSVERRFAVYCSYLLQACEKGLFRKPGPAAAAGAAGKAAEEKPEEDTDSSLKPPPQLKQSRLLGFLQGSAQETTGTLAGLAAVFVFAASTAFPPGEHRQVWITCAGILVAACGAALFCYSLLLLYYRRMAENTPTSKVRSLSMGFAELAGRARPYYDLRTAYTLTRCVYYECSYYKYQRTGDTSRWRLSSTLSSGKLAFYLEDETGQVLINPEGAYYAIKRARQTMRGRFIPSLAIKLDDPYTKVTEDLIPLGAQIYVLGSAHTKRRGRQHQERLVDRLRELKRDQRRMARYDSNRDGHIDSQEWDAARADMERQIYAESLAGQRKPEETVVVEKPKFGLLPFIVADSEDGLLRKLAIRSRVFLACGAVAFACGIGILL